jgi:CRP-like cAMP-binding protein
MNYSKPLQALLPESEIKLLERHASWTNVGPGTSLVRHRGAGRSLVLVLSGSVVVERPGAEPVTLTAEPGQPLVFAELTLLSYRLFRTANVTATSDALVVELAGSKWDRHLSKLSTLQRFVERSTHDRKPDYAALDLATRTRAYENYQAYLAAIERLNAPQ